MEKKLEKLRRFNIIMGGFHFVQGIIMIFLASSVIQKIGEFKPMIVQYYLRFNTTTRSLEPAVKELFELPFGYMVASFLLISAIAHALIALNSKKYFAGLKQGVNKFRWFEYALSSSVMIVLIAHLVRDLRHRFLDLDLRCQCSNEFLWSGYGTTQRRREKEIRQLGPFYLGVPLRASHLGSPSCCTCSERGILTWCHGFVWAIVGTYFVAFNTFPVNMILQYKGVGKWKDYLYGERIYIILSLVAKSILAWLVLFGAMQP